MFSDNTPGWERLSEGKKVSESAVQVQDGHNGLDLVNQWHPVIDIGLGDEVSDQLQIGSDIGDKLPEKRR